MATTVRSKDPTLPSGYSAGASSPALVQKDFQKAASDGTITPEEIKSLVNTARRGGLTESKADMFKNEAAANKHLMTEDAAAASDDFIKNKMRLVELLDPGSEPNDPNVVKIDVHRLEPQVVDGAEPIIGGVRGKDADQEYIGDCFWMAAESSVAQMQPQVIENSIKKLADGTYSVKLYAHAGGDDLEKRTLHIDKNLPRNNWYGYYYARGADPKELWPALLEKAFAQMHGSYAAIEGGDPGAAMESLTGKPSVTTHMRSAGMTPEKIYGIIKDAMNNSQPTTAATLGDSSAKKFDGTNIYSDHTYTVLAARKDADGNMFVKLRNPWGESEPDGNGRDDGIFEIPFDQFMSLFSDVAVNG